MHLAILVTNTDVSEFAQRHPKDGEKFTVMILGQRPDWEISVYSVKDGVFPERITDFDGMIITGSPASVQSGDSWIAKLLDVIRLAYAQNVPMFGACFGHQAIALALGGEVGRNPGGWVFGLTEANIVARSAWMQSLDDRIVQYGAHIEQVTKLPEGAKILATSVPSPISSFAIEDRVYCTQNHPEMTPEFVDALIEEYADTLGPDVAKAARASQSRPADNEPFAQSIVRFFEAAQ